MQPDLRKPPAKYRPCAFPPDVLHLKHVIFGNFASTVRVRVRVLLLGQVSSFAGLEPPALSWLTEHGKPSLFHDVSH